MNAHEMNLVPYEVSGQKNDVISPEFTFKANDISISGQGQSVNYEGSKIEDLANGGKRLIVSLSSKNAPLSITVNYEVFDSYPAMRKWISITNEGKDLITLRSLCFDEGKIFLCPSSRLEVNAVYGIQPREIFYTGRVEDCAIYQKDALSGEGVIFLNEAPGFLKRTEVNQWWNSFCTNSFRIMYDTDLFPFCRSLSAGETFNSAASDLIFVDEGNGYDDPRWAMPAYTSQALTRKGITFSPPWIYNTWEPFWRNINEKIVMDLINVASKMGFDVFTIDDGWQQEYGSNEIDTARFPGGLDRIRDSIEKKGMRLGLWVPLATIGIKTSDALNHAEWVCRDNYGKEKTTGTADGSKEVMCLATPYRNLAAKRISELIKRYHLKYVKLDLTTIFNAYGETPGCYAQGHEHNDWEESLCRIYEGIKEVTQQIYQDYPDILLDITFELWGQKHIIDYGLLASGDLDWLSNVDDFSTYSPGPRQARTLLYQRSLAIPVETMLIGNLQAQTGSIEEKFATAIGSSPLLLGDLRKLNGDQITWYNEKIKWFKQLRKQLNLNDSFFPMGAWQQPNASNWDGFARLDHSGEGIVVAFRNEAISDAFVLRVPAMPEGKFILKSILTGQSSGPYLPRDFRNGISLQFAENHSTEIIEIRLIK